MNELGRFLKVVYGPNEAFRTVQGTFRQWCNRALADLASQHRSKFGRRKAISANAPNEPSIDTAQFVFSICMPDCVRVECRKTSEAGECESLLVTNRQRWWHRDHDGTVEMDEIAESDRGSVPVPEFMDIERLFFASSLREFFVALSIEQTGLVRTAGRDCVQLRAIPREGAQLWPHWLPYGAEDYEFHADPEFGVLLYIAGRFAGEVFESFEVTQVRFDDPMNEADFSYEPTAREHTRPADPVAEHLSLRVAVERAPFVVLAPAGVPEFDDGNIEVFYHAPNRHSERARITLRYRGNSNFWIDEAETDDFNLTDLHWEELDLHGKRLLVSEPGAGDGMTIVALERCGTHVQIYSKLDRERLIAIAGSLAPVTSVGN